MGSKTMDDVNLQTDLYDYQAEAADKLSESRVGALFMDMGTGKTRTAIELVMRRADRAENAIWCCPVSLKETIRQELAKHAPSADVYIFGENTTSTSVPHSDWHVVGIESISQSDRQVFALDALVGKDTFMIVDESGYIKNHRAKRTRRLRQLGKRCRWRLILTGTPISQGIEDLFAQMTFLSPEILGYRSFYAFADNHLEYHPDYKGLVVRTHNEAYLAAKMQPYVYQVTRDQALPGLPDKVHETRYFHASTEQEALYEEAKSEMLMRLAPESIGSYEIFRLFTALQQIVCGFWNRREISDEHIDDFGYIRISRGELSDLPVRHERASHGRVRALMKTIEDITGRAGEDEKVIIWARYHYCVRQVICALGTEHGPGSVAELHGHLGEEERMAQLARWRDSNGARFLVATPETGAHGLTLTEARYAIFYNNSFKYATRLQAEDRIHRIGQKRRPTYIDLVCSDTIDERIQKALSEKGNVLEAFREEVEAVKEESEGAMQDLAQSL
jgi:SNF2 family DNA or RNA helicase